MLVRGFFTFAFCMPFGASQPKTKIPISVQYPLKLLGVTGYRGVSSNESIFFIYPSHLSIMSSHKELSDCRLHTPLLPHLSLCLQGGSSGVAAGLAASLTAAGKGDVLVWPIRTQPGPPPPIGGQDWAGWATPTGLSWAGGREWGWQQLSLLHSALGSAHPDTSSAPHCKNCAKF